MHNILREIKGTSSVEFALVALLFFTFVFGIMDAARMMWEWNRASKATHWGARFAVVNDPPAPGLAVFSCLGLPTGTGTVTGNGMPCPPGALSPNPVVCTSSGCSGSFGSFDSAAFNAIVARMAAIYDKITPANVRVEYRNVGLGFAGNPFGSDLTPLITVSLQGMTFNFLTPILSSLTTVNLPDFRTSMTAEDMNTN